VRLATRTCRVAIFVLLLVVLGLLPRGVAAADPAPAASDPAPVPAPASDSAFAAASERHVLVLENRIRAAATLPVVRSDPRLVRIARWRSADMVSRGYFSHSIPPDGTTVFDELTRRHYCWRAAGENIGWNNVAGAAATSAIVRQFLASPSHRAIMLGRTWDAIGVGVATAPDGRHFWTLVFARTCTSSPS
jgi:uncharacterized protein YkwD